jgi:putative tryptophan/tyrosine transport system substrate-binding protein
LLSGLPVFVTEGGLASYGASYIKQSELAANYVDRILRGEHPGDLPVQQPTEFDFAINLKTAKKLGLSVAPSLLISARDVIE